MRNKCLLGLFLGLAFSGSVMAQADRSTQNYCLCQDEASLQQAKQLDSASLQVLEIGRQMALVTKTIILGSCWDFVNEVFIRAGVKSSKKVVFKTKKAGPYADSKLVQPGDWVYHINHSNNNIDHSAIFICWKDYASRQAVTLSYAGMNRSVPARYAVYDLRSIFAIFRPQYPKKETLASAKAK
ncbi:MAG: hypothetical protein ACKO6Q_05135 [Bacteroidota bacterium]